jgi:hypothetical protein
LITGYWQLLVVQFRQTLLYGDPVNRRQGWVSFVVLGFALCAPAFLHARTKTPAPANHAQVPKQVQKSSKQYQKQMKKQQKQQAKWAKKQTKENQKQHPNQHQTVKHTVT